MEWIAAIGVLVVWLVLRERIRALEANLAEQEGTIRQLSERMRAALQRKEPEVTPEAAIGPPPPTREQEKPPTVPEVVAALAKPPAPAVPTPKPAPPVRLHSPRLEPAVARPSPPPEPQLVVDPGPTLAERLGRIDWESFVGVRLFSWVAGLALLLAGLFFLRYTVDRGWLTPPIRMAMGLAVGIVVLVLCELKVARRYAVTANALDAAGIGILFGTLFAAYTRWHLLPAWAAGLLLVLVAAVAVILSIRRNSMFIAILGLVGGFATPALLSTGEDKAIGLFSYLLLLNAGLAWVAVRKRWVILSLLSLVFTTVYQWGWVVKFLEEGKFPTAVAVFAIFPVFGLTALLLSDRRRAAASVPGSVPGLHSITAAAALLPLAFALYAAATPAYGSHWGFLFGFLAVVTISLAVLAAARGPEELHLVGGATTLVVFGLWLARSYRPSGGPEGDAVSGYWPLALGLLAAFVGLHLAIPGVARRFGRAFSGAGEQGVVTAPLLLFALPALFVMEPATAAIGWPFAGLVGLLAVMAAAALLYRDGRIWWVATTAALLSASTWCARHQNPENVATALLLLTAVIGLVIAVPWLALKTSRSFVPAVAEPWSLLGSLAVLVVTTRPALPGLALFAVLILVLVLRWRLDAETERLQRSAALPLVGGLLGWGVLIRWWFHDGALTSDLAAGLGGILLLGVGSTLLALRRPGLTLDPTANGSGELELPSSASVHLGLAVLGHAILVPLAPSVAAANSSGMLVATLLLVDLAILLAARKLTGGWVWFSSLAATAVVLGVHAASAAASRSAILAGIGGAAALGLLGDWLDRRSAGRTTTVPRDSTFSHAGACGLLFGMLLLAHLSMAANPPSDAILLGGYAALTLTFLSWCGISGVHAYALPGAITLIAALAAWRSAHLATQDAVTQIGFAASAVLLFTVFPLALGSRARSGRAPFVSSLILHAGAFYFLRDGFLRAGWSGIQGLVPVAQALFLLPLVRRLVTLEPAGARDVGRLAMVAGSALAFITAAVPLQLEKQWISLAWALLGASLWWLRTKVPHVGLTIWAAALHATVFARLVLNPWVLGYHAREARPILNWFLYTYGIVALGFFLSAWLARRSDTVWVAKFRAVGLYLCSGTVLLFVLLNLEIADYFSSGERLAFHILGGGAGLAHDLAYTLGWAIFSILLLAAGIRGRNRGARIAAIGLLAITVLKAFLHDTWSLGGLYRVGSLVGLAISLAAVAVALQRFVLRRTEES